MANTYTQLHIHIAFAVSGRMNVLKQSFRVEIFKYITGIVRNKGQRLLAINGVEDHIHILLNVEPTVALSDLVRDIKNNSSRFINQRGLIPGVFRWQEGLAAFTCSRSHKDHAVASIENQEQHHRRTSFREAYEKMLEEFEVDHDRRYAFRSIDEDDDEKTKKATS